MYAIRSYYESLVTHPATMTHADIPPEEQAEGGLTPALVRLSVGMEDPDDLVADVAQALRKARRGSGSSAAGR